jgi:hypothetical protein
LSVCGVCSVHAFLVVTFAFSLKRTQSPDYQRLCWRGRWIFPSLMRQRTVIRIATTNANVAIAAIIMIGT